MASFQKHKVVNRLNLLGSLIAKFDILSLVSINRRTNLFFPPDESETDYNHDWEA